uniref:Beta-glucuronidase n=1 Tax=Ditylenchus dipsaci TaxID=166011 RepID=A0A915DSM8_9BILA
MKHFSLIFYFLAVFLKTNALIFPQQNEFRELVSLDGLWTFVREPTNSKVIGLQNNWAKHDLSTFKNATVMPVPSAFNDITVERELRDHVGWCIGWQQRAIIRFGSVQYAAYVYINDQLTTVHIGGHLPFDVEIKPSTFLNNPFYHPIIITVAVNNTLSSATIPPGDFLTKTLPDGRELVEQTPNFDFFNYAGILRPVNVQLLPNVFISDVKILADFNGNFSYRVDFDNSSLNGLENGEITAKVIVFDQKAKNRIYEGEGLQNFVAIPDVKTWWPRGYGQPNLYVAEIHLMLNNSSDKSTAVVIDIYRETFGFRTVTIDKDSIFINNKKFYCLGFGMHEDFEVHGRGFNRAVMTKDLNMLEWFGGNCYRTSHYPYSEERAYEADRRGIAVITETPAVGMESFSKANQKLHGQMLTEMILRDKNHPSVILWSISNEPATSKSSSRQYYKNLISLAHQLDITRPVTIVYATSFDKDKTADLVDVICVNGYYGWYRNTTELTLINSSVIDFVMGWKKKYQKPVIWSEYGAEAIPGMSEQISMVYTEQYQVDVIHQTHRAFDHLAETNGLAGEMIWNFADFMTAQDLTRVVGNHKGMLTRTRKPKQAAYVLRKRYLKLSTKKMSHDEL